MTAKRVHKNKLIKRSILAVLVVGLLGLFIANEMVKRIGFNNLGDFLSNYWENEQLQDSAETIQMSIHLSDTDFAFMEKRREEALDRGIQINDGNNYVDCEVSIGGEDSVKGEIRLKGHMTDHLEGEKWSFRVKTKDPVLGMYRFSLQHPGTRNYAYEWVYHELLANEDIINLNYDFIHLKLRDKDLGIYAIEEHFGQHVLEHNDRPKGAILRWNPGLYWEGRIDQMQGVYLDEDYSDYSSSFVEPYDRGVVLNDPELLKNYLDGSRLLEGFRRSELSVSQVFDVQKMARFHAIIDLVGGYHSLDWSDVKFFYNSESQRIEPVGYESFSIRKTESIAGQRTPNLYGEVEAGYHDKLFADPIFFKAYIENLERICDEGYINQFIESIKGEHQKKLAILATEWPYRKFTFDPYFENVELIRHNLSLPKPFHAFLNESQDSTLILSLSPVSDFPIELIELEINGKEKFDLNGFILPAKARGTFATYFPISLVHHSKSLKNLVITARIPGCSSSFEVEVNEFPSFEQHGYEKRDISTVQSLELHPDIEFDPHDSVLFFKTNQVEINENYLISEHKLRVLPGQSLHFNSGTLTVIDNSIEGFGGTDDEILILSNTNEPAIFLMNAKMEFNNTVFEGGTKMINLYKSSCILAHCIGVDIGDTFLSGQFSDITMNACSFGSVNRVLETDRSMVNLKEVNGNRGTEFARLYGSKMNIRYSNFSNYRTPFVLNHLSLADMWSSQLADNGTVAELNNSSELKVFASDLGEADVGFVIDKEGVSVEPSKYVLRGTNQNRIKQLRK